jgi:hypothetical protein
MLELRPTCEHCNRGPNCGGGFVPRPVRPSKNWKGDNYLGKDPAAHAKFSAPIAKIPPERR